MRAVNLLLLLACGNILLHGAAGQGDILGSIGDLINQIFGGGSGTGGLNDYGAGTPSNCNYLSINKQFTKCQNALGGSGCPAACQTLVQQVTSTCPELVSALDPSFITACGGTASPTQPVPSPSINPPSDTPPFSAPPGSADYTNDVTTIGNDYDTSPGTPPGASPELPVFVGGTPPPGAATPVAPPPTPLIYINIPPPPSPPVVLPAAAPPTPLIYLTPPPAPVTNASVPATPDASTLSLPQDCYNYIQQNSNGLTTCGALLSAGVTGCPQECLDFYSNVPSDCIASITENSANLAAIYNVPSNITDPASACGKVFNAAPRTAAPVMLIAAAAAGAALLVF